MNRFAGLSCTDAKDTFLSIRLPTWANHMSKSFVASTKARYLWNRSKSAEALLAGAGTGAGVGALSATAACVTPCLASRADFLSAQNLSLPAASSLGHSLTVWPFARQLKQVGT